MPRVATPRTVDPTRRIVRQTPPPDPDPPALPAAELQPYDPDHPVYRPVAGAALWSGSGSVVLPGTIGVFCDTGADSPPIFIGDTGDPLWSATIAGEAFSIHAPAGITPGTGEDYPLVILDDTTHTEYRMWQAVVNAGTWTITCSNGGVGSYAQEAGVTGRANIRGSHTGSGQSYLVGMIRPHEIAAGRIPHAIRAASSFIGGTWVSPADRSDQSGSTPPEVPMGTRMFLDASVDLDDPDITTAINGQVSTVLGRRAARIILAAIQEYGLAFSDGSASAFNLYFEGDIDARWTTEMGAPNGSGTWNDIGRAVKSAIDVVGWSNMHVTDALHLAGE